LIIEKLNGIEYSYAWNGRHPDKYMSVTLFIVVLISVTIDIATSEN